jgi:hypothetical protein
MLRKQKEHGRPARKFRSGRSGKHAGQPAALRKMILPSQGPQLSLADPCFVGLTVNWKE